MCLELGEGEPKVHCPGTSFPHLQITQIDELK